MTLSGIAGGMGERAPGA